MMPVLEVDNLRVHYLTRFGAKVAGGRWRFLQAHKGEILASRANRAAARPRWSAAAWVSNIRRFTTLRAT